MICSRRCAASRPMNQDRRHFGRIAFASLSIAVMLTAGGCPRPLPPGSDRLVLTPVADGLTSPVAIAEAPDDTGRLFIVDQVGLVWIITRDGLRLTTPFLDVRSRLVDLNAVFDERGLLGFAFHPDFRLNRKFYVYYTAPTDSQSPSGFDSQNVICEFRASIFDPNITDMTTERLVLRLDQPQPNHNAGQLAFGPDGYLYIGTGDGGGAGDTGTGHTPTLGNAQDKESLLGKILRIDVDQGSPYAIPDDNPFFDDTDARGEIYALGFRNPWRFSFDASTDRLFVADVGQALREEVNIVEAGGNYGWNRREGDLCFDPDNPNNPPDVCLDVSPGGDPLRAPILSYPHTASGVGESAGISVIGGFVYRGSLIPALRGRYVFGDYSTSFTRADGSLFVGSEGFDGAWTFEEIGVAGSANGRLGRYLLAFGTDRQGELYLLTSQSPGPSSATGVVYRVVGLE